MAGYGHKPVFAIAGEVIKLCSIYVIGIPGTSTVRLGYSCDPQRVRDKMQLDSRELIELLFVAWAPDLKVARRVVQHCHRILHKAHKECGDGFAVNVEWAKRVIDVAARDQGIPLYSDRNARRLLTTKGDMRREMIMRVVGRPTGQ